MPGTLAGAQRAIVATDTISGRLRMIEAHGWLPHRDRMTGLTGIAGLKMRVVLALSINIIVA